MLDREGGCICKLVSRWVGARLLTRQVVLGYGSLYDAGARGTGACSRGRSGSNTRARHQLPFFQLGWMLPYPSEPCFPEPLGPRAVEQVPALLRTVGRATVNARRAMPIDPVIREHTRRAHRRTRRTSPPHHAPLPHPRSSPVPAYNWRSIVASRVRMLKPVDIRVLAATMQ
jgi:hypothetical protein